MAQAGPMEFLDVEMAAFMREPGDGRSQVLTALDNIQLLVNERLAPLINTAGVAGARRTRPPALRRRGSFFENHPWYYVVGSILLVGTIVLVYGIYRSSEAPKEGLERQKSGQQRIEQQVSSPEDVKKIEVLLEGRDYEGATALLKSSPSPVQVTILADSRQFKRLLNAEAFTKAMEEGKAPDVISLFKRFTPVQRAEVLTVQPVWMELLTLKEKLDRQVYEGERRSTDDKAVKKRFQGQKELSSRIGNLLGEFPPDFSVSQNIMEKYITKREKSQAYNYVLMFFSPDVRADILSHGEILSELLRRDKNSNDLYRYAAPLVQLVDRIPRELKSKVLAARDVGLELVLIRHELNKYLSHDEKLAIFWTPITI